MTSRQTKAGKTLYQTLYKGSVVESPDRGAIQSLENGDESKVKFKQGNSTIFAFLKEEGKD